MQGIALCVLAIGIDGALGGQETIVMILSMVFGAMIGEWIDIDARIKGGIQKLEQKYARGNGQQDLGPGFVAGVMIFCIGSMSILGSLEAGLTGSNTTLYTKSILDGITAILLGSSLGAGVDPIGDPSHPDGRGDCPLGRCSSPRLVRCSGSWNYCGRLFVASWIGL